MYSPLLRLVVTPEVQNLGCKTKRILDVRGSPDTSTDDDGSHAALRLGSIHLLTLTTLRYKTKSEILLRLFYSSPKAREVISL